MNGFYFWRRWLVLVSWALVVFGLGLSLFNQAPLFDLMVNDRINPAFWRGGRITPEAKVFQQWVYGVLGAVLAGWAMLMALFVQHAFPLKERWVWRSLALGIGIWFVVDSALSLHFGVAFNALVNLLLLLALGVPLAATRKHFTR
jgi:hypothetical protein